MDWRLKHGNGRLPIVRIADLSQFAGIRNNPAGRNTRPLLPDGKRGASCVLRQGSADDLFAVN